MHAIAPANTAPQLSERVLSRGADTMNTLLVGNHFLIREALRGVLKELKNDAVVLEALDGQEAMRLFRAGLYEPRCPRPGLARWPLGARRAA